MASSSSNSFCFHCQNVSSEPLRNGWDLSTGKFAKLCTHCFSIYEAGNFCETFHLNQGDWRNCKFCEKPVHRSCLVSYKDWFPLHHGAIICMECSKINSFLTQNFSNVMDLAEEIRMERYYWPHVCMVEKYTVVPMFEFLLNADDTNNKHGCIIIPKEHAEVYFPEVSDPDGISLLAIEKTGVRFWDLHLHLWRETIYVLYGLRDYIISNNLQGGDTLKFSRLVPDGTYILGFGKAKPPREQAVVGSSKYIHG